jgi:DHA2 family multidrug resistance protein-like MFS transporter
VASAPRERSGAAGGIGVMSRLLGQAVGVSFVAVIFELTGRGGVALHGVSLALLCGAGCTAISGIISAVPQPHLQPE